MARNKPLKLLTEAPPEPESSYDQQPSGSSNEGDEVAADDTEVTSSSAASSDEEEENQTTSTPFLPPSKKPTTVSITVNKKATLQSSSSSDNSDDEAPFAKLKPTNATTKPRSKPTHTPTEKRPAENNDEKDKSSKRAKKEKPSATGPGPNEEVSKKLFQRVFSGDDEIAMLKGLIEFKERKGGDPMKNDDEFYNFIKKLLHVEVNKVQIVDKVRRLKKKFNNAKKKKITNEHEKKLFELSKRIWEVKDEVEEDGGDKDNNVNVGVISMSALKSSYKENNGVLGSDMKTKMKKEEDEGGVMPVVDEDFKVGESEVKEGMRVEALRRMSAKGRDEIREMWRKVEIAQLEVHLMRNEARVEENKRIMEALGLVKR